MRIIAVDDKPVPRKALVKAIGDAEPDAEVTACANAEEVLVLPDIAGYDAAFVDIDMPGMNGVQLARELKKIHPQLNIVFATGFGEYMADAFALHSSGYIMKPVTVDKVRAELDNLRFPPQSGIAAPDRLVVRCFDAFEVFANGEPVVFERAKSKELFAYLVDRRGAMCSIGEIEASMWEDRAATSSQRSYLRTLVADMRSTLESLGFGDVVVKHRGFVGIRTDAIDCDYYKFLEGDPLAIASYRGEYMSQYSWAEETHARLG
ncbi:MAG: response regulator [Coriobacteriales bacterium]|jgi:two-component system LytT family response regulator